MRYLVKGYREPEGVVALPFDTVNAAEAMQQAEKQGFKVLSVKGGSAWKFGFSRRNARFPLMLFSQELLALLDAGLTLVEAMEALAEKEHHTDTKRVLDQVIGRLYEGQTFSQALTQFPAAFPQLYVATVRASERSGGMRDALTRYVGYQSQLEVVRKKLVSASIYPVLLMGVGGLVTLFLLAYVVPKFSHVYEDMGGDLPLLSRALLEWGKLLEAHGGTILLGTVGMLAVVVYLATRPSFRQWFGNKLWKIPALGERMRLYQLARFYRTLGMLLTGGMPAVVSLEMASGLLTPAMRGNLRQAAQWVREGRTMSEAMEAHHLTTPVALRMLRVGERTGNMGSIMERIASFYDEEMARWVDWFTRLFEPILMAVIGVVIGGIVVLMYLPIFELAGSIQ
jgi:general secretion pathway protein F